MSPSTLLSRMSAIAGCLVLCSGALLAQQVAGAPANSNQTVQFDVFLPVSNISDLDSLIQSLHTSGSSNYQKWLSPTDFQSRFGPTAHQVSQVAAALKPFGITVTSTRSHSVHVQGTAAAVQAAFGVKLSNITLPTGTQKVVANTAVKLPQALSQMGAQVLAFNSTALNHRHSVNAGPAPLNRYSTAGPYWFDDIKQAYEFPSYQALTGKGRNIGIVMSNDFLDSDMALYFGHEKLAVPTYKRVPVDGGGPFDPNLSFETSLDLQQAGGMAPGATITLFNIPDLSNQAILDAYLTILNNNDVDIVSLSFGGPEGFYTAAYNGGTDFTGILRIFDDVFKQGVAQGITFVASSGDNGGLGLPSFDYFLGNPAVFLPGIEFPASSPHVTAVGGTNLTTTFNPPSRDSKYVSENAYGDPLLPYDPFGIGNTVSGGVWGSGGGPSVVFSKPPFQYLVNTGTNMRAIPDVSLQMGGCPVGVAGTCPPDRSSTVVAVAGGLYLVIGTSVSAPEFAGLLALQEQYLGGKRLGNVNYLLYGLGATQSTGLYKAFHQGIPGNNGAYSSTTGTPGYNMVVGNGTAIGRNLILAPFVPAAGTPQTPSNP